MLCAAEMITAIILNLYLVKEEAEASGLLDCLRRMGGPGELGVNMLSGLTLGLLLAERANRRFTVQLLSYTHKYHDSVGKLSAERQQVLGEFAREVMLAVGL